MQKFTQTNKEIVAAWKAREIVWSADLGGMGPGYEQAIQVMLFELLSDWGDRELENPTDNEFPDAFHKQANETARRLREWGFSGMQVEVATSTAYQFIKFGYSSMMNKLPEDRRIMVSDGLVPRPCDQARPAV